jgi:hypothetical protein
MTSLSPKAQKIKDSIRKLYGDERAFDLGWPDESKTAIAVLRSAACLIKPHISRTPWLTSDDGYFNETFENLEALGELNSYSKLLSIAAELEVVS